MVALGGRVPCLLGKLGAEKVCARKNLESENSRLFGHTKPVLAEWDRQARGSSKCTASSVKAGSYDQYWKISNKKSSYTANCAIGSATGKLYYGPSPVTTINKEVVLKCSINGTLS